MFELNRPASKLKWVRAWLAKRQERKVVSLPFIRTIYVSDSDADMGRSLCPPHRVSSILTYPNGVNTTRFALKDYSSAPNGILPVLLFTGVMEYLPNIEAAVTLVENVLPHLKHKVSVRLVGMRPSPRVVALASNPSVTVTGAVDDIVPEYQKADVFVVPMLSGTGFKNKIIEAMSCGLPIVSTTHALGGFSSLPPGVITADTWSDMAGQIDSLLDTKGRACELGLAAAKFARESYSWDIRAEELLKLLGEAR